jgi:hypothetical protein
MWSPKPKVKVAILNNLFRWFETNTVKKIWTQSFLKKEKLENSVVTKVAWSMKQYFGGILRRIYKPCIEFFIKSPYPNLSKCIEALEVMNILIFYNFISSKLMKFLTINCVHVNKEQNKYIDNISAITFSSSGIIFAPKWSLSAPSRFKIIHE